MGGDKIWTHIARVQGRRLWGTKEGDKSSWGLSGAVIQEWHQRFALKSEKGYGMGTGKEFQTRTDAEKI